jgi:hypothetical protein
MYDCQGAIQVQALFLYWMADFLSNGTLKNAYSLCISWRLYVKFHAFRFDLLLLESDVICVVPY